MDLGYSLVGQKAVTSAKHIPGFAEQATGGRVSFSLVWLTGGRTNSLRERYHDKETLMEYNHSCGDQELPYGHNKCTKVIFPGEKSTSVIFSRSAVMRKHSLF